MTYHVVIEPSAERGIREAVRWIAGNASPAIAAKWYNGLIRKAETLKTLPTRCPVAAESDKFPEEIRELLYGNRRYNYRIIFTISGDTVHVLYVHHNSRDELSP